MDKIIVIPRVEGKDKAPVLFLPEHPANFGHIMCYAHVGQHSEASLDYYNSTKPDKANACADLLREYASIPPSQSELVIRKRINREWLATAWKR